MVSQTIEMKWIIDNLINQRVTSSSSLVSTHTQTQTCPLIVQNASSKMTMIGPSHHQHALYIPQWWELHWLQHHISCKTTKIHHLHLLYAYLYKHWHPIKLHGHKSSNTQSHGPLHCHIFGYLDTLSPWHLNDCRLF